MAKCVCVFIWVSEQRNEAATCGPDVQSRDMCPGIRERLSVWDLNSGYGHACARCVEEHDQDGGEGDCKTACNNVRAAKERDCRRGRELV